MPYQSHEAFSLPSDPLTRIYRYMDLAKFLAVLETQSLFFPTVTQLAKDDPFEGWYTGMYGTGQATGPAVNTDYSAALKEFQEKDLWAIFKRPGAVDGFPNYIRKMHSTTCVSCWHMQPQESAAMWSIYGRDHQGIAIVSSVETLRESSQNYAKPVYIGAVNYLDYTRELVSTDNGYIPFVTKRISFQHEHELRAVVRLSDEETTSTGISVPVNLNLLIQQVLVAPTAAEWLVNLVTAVARKYGLSAPVSQSGLLSLPS
jgi:hypothetical protein